QFVDADLQALTGLVVDRGSGPRKAAAQKQVAGNEVLVAEIGQVGDLTDVGATLAVGRGRDRGMSAHDMAAASAPFQNVRIVSVGALIAAYRHVDGPVAAIVGNKNLRAPRVQPKLAIVVEDGLDALDVVVATDRKKSIVADLVEQALCRLR